ncbi:MAG: 50S ribosomal protein L17 [Verrucomicrobia bacterium]|nr:50S ribosomal protein L17 [Verrucomicrobiota bacterium]MCF7707843.1 50S ribosomal protein L17 [Verrucomicrobiota bacterium]
MRHLKRTAKLGRVSSHRNAMLANLVCSLIKHQRVVTTLAKAKAARSLAEKMITLGKKGSIHHRRLAAARLHQEDAVRILFNELAPKHMDRPGGYTRIVKLVERKGDAAKMAVLEWVEPEMVSAKSKPRTEKATVDKEESKAGKESAVSETKE